MGQVHTCLNLIRQRVMAGLSLIKHPRKVKIFSLVGVRNIRTKMCKCHKTKLEVRKFISLLCICPLAGNIPN